MAAAQVLTIGYRARAALAGAGPMRVVATPSRSVYLTVGGELIWLGPVGAAMHARAVVVSALPQPLDPLAVDLTGASVWRPSLPAGAECSRVVRAACSTLSGALPALGKARGFGILLVGQRLDGPFERAAAPARALARACDDDDPEAAVTAAEDLIGLGPGLTPAGDDFVGGAFFARTILAPATRAGRWDRAAMRLREVAARRTHPVSAVLLSDLLGGEGYQPLHDLAGAMAEGAIPSATAAARRLTDIGHSSGWDMLAGFFAGVRGLDAVAGIPAAAR